MADNNYLEERIIRAENELGAVCQRVNAFAVSQAAANAKLDSLLETTQELKVALNRIREKPATLVEKTASALIGAAAAGTVALFFK